MVDDVVLVDEAMVTELDDVVDVAVLIVDDVVMLVEVEEEELDDVDELVDVVEDVELVVLEDVEVDVVLLVVVVTHCVQVALHICPAGQPS